MTLVELIIAFTILALLTSMAVPLARSRVRRERERDLRIALREIHTAIDKYKDMADLGQLGQQNAAKEGYPETLEILVEGVKVTGQAGGGRGIPGMAGAGDGILGAGGAAGRQSRGAIHPVLFYEDHQTSDVVF